MHNICKHETIIKNKIAVAANNNDNKIYFIVLAT